MFFSHIYNIVIFLQGVKYVFIFYSFVKIEKENTNVKENAGVKHVMKINNT